MDRTWFSRWLGKKGVMLHDGKRGLWLRINSVTACLLTMELNFYENMKKNIEREIICYKKVSNFVIHVIKC